jgi:Domain of unknown function (DUF4397)
VPAGAASAAAGDATVRVAHLSPDAPSVDVHVNGAKTLSGVLYKTVSKYLSVPPGQYRYEVRPAGADADPGAHPRRAPPPYALAGRRC